MRKYKLIIIPTFEKIYIDFSCSSFFCAFWFCITTIFVRKLSYFVRILKFYVLFCIIHVIRVDQAFQSDHKDNEYLHHMSVPTMPMNEHTYMYVYKSVFICEVTEWYSTMHVLRCFSSWHIICINYTLLDLWYPTHPFPLFGVRPKSLQCIDGKNHLSFTLHAQSMF